MRSLTLGVLVLGLVTTLSAQTPAPPRQVYDDAADVKAEIAKSVSRAQREHKRLLLVFGGNWCGDCLALDKSFHAPPAAGLIETSFIVVHVSIGRFDLNKDVAANPDPAREGRARDRGARVRRHVALLATQWRVRAGRADGTAGLRRLPEQVETQEPFGTLEVTSHKSEVWSTGRGAFARPCCGARCVQNAKCSPA